MMQITIEPGGFITVLGACGHRKAVTPFNGESVHGFIDYVRRVSATPCFRHDEIT